MRAHMVLLCIVFRSSVIRCESFVACQRARLRLVDSGRSRLTGAEGSWGVKDAELRDIVATVAVGLVVGPQASGAAVAGRLPEARRVRGRPEWQMGARGRGASAG